MFDRKIYTLETDASRPLGKVLTGLSIVGGWQIQVLGGAVQLTPVLETTIPVFRSKPVGVKRGVIDQTCKIRRIRSRSRKIGLTLISSVEIERREGISSTVNSQIVLEKWKVRREVLWGTALSLHYLNRDQYQYKPALYIESPRDREVLSESIR